MRILVTGVRGQLGGACLEAFAAAGHRTAGIDLQEGDLADEGVAARLVAEADPERVIHCAASTAVDRAEERPEEAEAGNARATAQLAAACQRHGAALTLVSTDYVFAGTDPAGYAEDAPRDPVNRYGASKARAEEAVERLALPWQIVRTSWLFGHGPSNFVRTIRRLLKERETLSVVDDQRGCPTYAPDLALLLRQLAERDAQGIFHGTNQGAATWFEFAREIARLSGADPDRIRPCATSDYPTPAPRPACSILLDTRLAALGVTRAPTWRDALARYLRWLEQNEERSGS
jgi:dTDP-4-dehydrorhamnose reductase